MKSQIFHEKEKKEKKKKTTSYCKVKHVLQVRCTRMSSQDIKDNSVQASLALPSSTTATFNIHVPNRLKRSLRPSILNRIFVGPGGSVQEFIHITVTTILMVFALQTGSDLLSCRLPLEIGAMEIAVKFGAGSLACVPDTPVIRSEVLVPFQSESGRPIGVAAVGPWRGAPTRIHEVQGLRDILGAEHLTQRDKDLLLRGLIVLVIDDVGLICDHGDEKDAAAGDKIW